MSRRILLRWIGRLLLAVITTGGWFPGSGQLATAQVLNSRAARDRQFRFERFRAAIDELRATFADDLEKIALYCEQHGLLEAAAETRQLALPLAPNIIQGRNLPRFVQAPISRSLPEAERKWREDLRRLQTDFANTLFDRAKLALNQGHISYAFDLIREVARQDPDHRFARRLLGFVRHDDQWVTFYEEAMLRKRQVRTEKYGWVKDEEHARRYENGERYFRNEWMSATKEAQIRQNFKDAWIVRTDHYEIRTNHSLEMAVELGNYLEDFYQIFFQTFASFLNSKDQLAALSKGGGSSRSAIGRPFVVHYYRTEREYLDTLQDALDVPIEGTTGLYLSGNSSRPGFSIAHFFHSTEATREERLATMYHEATHQLFSEAYASNHSVGVNSEFWAIEAVACYMESLRIKGERFSLGNPKYLRFQNAQHRLMIDGYYVPLQRLSAMGQQEFQSDPERSKNYSQGAGLAHFFMHYDSGLYREQFINYLSDIYSRNPRVRTTPRNLQTLTEVPFQDLDRQYRDYMSGLDTGQEQLLNTADQ